jgi:hypothetical protein
LPKNLLASIDVEPLDEGLAKAARRGTRECPKSYGDRRDRDGIRRATGRRGLHL